MRFNSAFKGLNEHTIAIKMRSAGTRYRVYWQICSNVSKEQVASIFPIKASRKDNVQIQRGKRGAEAKLWASQWQMEDRFLSSHSYICVPSPLRSSDFYTSENVPRKLCHLPNCMAPEKSVIFAFIAGIITRISCSVCLVFYNYSLPLFAPIFIYISFSSRRSTVQIYIQTGYRNNSVIYPCTHCIYSRCNKSL